MKKRIIALFLTLLMITSLMPMSASADASATMYVSALGSDTTGAGTETAPFATIQKAVDSISTSGTVILQTDLEISSASSNEYCFEILDGKNITLDGGKNKIKMSNSVKPFCVSEGKLTLTNVDIDMNGIKYTTSDGMNAIRVARAGELVLEDGSIIENAKRGEDFTNLLVLGTVTMNKGAIIRNMEGTYGAIRVEGNDSYDGTGNFIMNGGLITGCTSLYGDEGVVFYISCGGTMRMSGGEISGNANKASSPGTIFLHANNLSTRGYNEFTATGGTISGNSATYGGVVYTASSANKINISGDVHFTDNKGTDFGGESNLYLGSNLLVNLTGGMGKDSMVGVYTSNVPNANNDVKFAINATMTDAAHFISDKMSTAGIIYDDGEKCWNSAGNPVIDYHHTNEANTLWLSTAALGYSVTIDSGITNGSVISDVEWPCAGDTVTLTVTPDEYYQLKSLTYTPKDGSATAATKVSDGVYSFLMPKANVTVTAEFEKCPHTSVTGHICDTCGKVISNHIDENKDYFCDICDCVLLEAPVVKAETNYIAGVRISWNSVEGAEDYEICMAENTDDSSVLAKVKGTTYTVPLSEAGKYSFVVRAIKGEAKSKFSKSASYYFVPTPELTKRENTSYGISLTWNKIAGASGYALYRWDEITNGSWARITTITDPNTVTWTDTESASHNGTVYHYTVRAIAEDGKTLSGCYSKGRTMIRLLAPTVSSAVLENSSAVTATWDYNDMATGYEYRILSDSEVIVTRYYGSNQALTRTIKNLDAGTSYQVQVRSVLKTESNGSYYSAWSTKTEATSGGTVIVVAK